MDFGALPPPVHRQPPIISADPGVSVPSIPTFPHATAAQREFTPRITRFLLLFLLVLTAIIYLGAAGRPSLLDDADSSHAIVAREMLQSGDWVVMHMNGIRWLAKAPIHYWLVAATYAVLGQGEFATRLPLALTVVALVAMIFFMGRHFFGPLAGFYAGLVMATSVGTFIFTRIMIPEAIYALEFTAIFYLFLRGWLEGGSGSAAGPASQRYRMWGCAVLTAMALLTRGLIGVIFPVGTIILFILVTRGAKRWRELSPLSSSLIFLMIAVPWHWIAIRRAPGFFYEYFISEHFMRAMGTRYPPDYSAVPLPLWLGAHLAWFFPWSVFLPLTFFAWRPLRLAWTRAGAAGLSREEQAQLFVVLWMLVIFLFFSVLGGSRMEYYSFGAWPAVALLLGMGLARSEYSQPVSARRCQALLALLGATLAAVLGYAVATSFGVKPEGDISQLLSAHQDDFYRVSMAHLFDLTPKAFALLRGPATGAAVAFFVGFTGAWLLRRAGRPLAANVTTAMAMAVFIFSANSAYGTFGPELGSRPLANIVVPYLRPQDQIVIYGNFDSGSSLAYYTGRQALIFNGRRNNLEFGSYYPDAPRIFLDDHDFPSLWASPQRIFLLAPPPYGREALIRLPPDRSYKMGDIGGKALYVNHPLVPGQKSLAEATIVNLQNIAK